MEARLIETRGGRTRIRVHEGGEGGPLVYLHAAGGLFPEDPFLARLAERYRVFAPCLPGYEDSEGAESLHTMLDVALWGFDVIEALGLDRPALVGHSMGGMIAAEMASICPREVDRLALIAPAGLWLDDAPIPDLFSLLPFELPELLFHDPRKGAELLTGGFEFQGSGAEDFAALLRRFEDLDFLQKLLIDNARKLGMAGKILFPIPERGLAERLPRVRARTTLIWGESDRFVPPRYAEAFLELLPGASLERIAEAGHMAPYEKPDEVLAALGRALEPGDRGG